MFSVVCAVAGLLSQDLRADLDALWQAQDLKGATVGVLVKEIGGEVLYSKNPDDSLVPASLVKLATALFALESLGPDYAPLTCAWREGSTVYLWGGGDPGLSVQDLLSFREVLQVQPGDRVIFDDSLFGKASRPSTWEPADFPYGYAAPIRSLTVNEGKVELWVEGNRAYLLPLNFGLEVKTRLRGGLLEVTVPYPDGKGSAKFTGLAPSPEPRKVATLSLPDPALSAGRVFHPKAQRGLAPGPPLGFLFLQAPPAFSLIVDEKGRAVVGLRRRTVAHLLKRMLEESDNVYAEMLLRLSAFKVGGATSWEEAMHTASQFLRSVGLREGSFSLVDGSGLSRRNRLSPRAVVTILERGLSGEYSPVFLEGLAEPGEGTLRERLFGFPVACKTGTLSGVSCLAGVVWRPSYPPVKAMDEPSWSPQEPIWDALSPFSERAKRRDGLSPLPLASHQGTKGLLFCIMIMRPGGSGKGFREVQDAMVARLSQFLQARAFSRSWREPSVPLDREASIPEWRGR